MFWRNIMQGRLPSGKIKMNILYVLAICTSCVLLSSCTDKPKSSCVGGSKTGMSVERMSNVDKYFMTTDFDKYIGASLGELEKSFEFSYRERVAITKPPAELVGLTYTFPSNYSFNVYFTEPKYTKYDSKTKKWDFRKIEKETIAGINVKHVGSADYYYCKDFGEVVVQ